MSVSSFVHTAQVGFKLRGGVGGGGGGGAGNIASDQRSTYETERVLLSPAVLHFSH